MNRLASFLAGIACGLITLGAAIVCHQIPDFVRLAMAVSGLVTIASMVKEVCEGP